jgi:hypothetical protein
MEACARVSTVASSTATPAEAPAKNCDSISAPDMDMALAGRDRSADSSALGLSPWLPGLAE